MHLSAIFIYPVKSMGGISLTEAVVEKAGLRHDRRWMLLDAYGKFLTQRQVPEMALFQMTLRESGISVSYPGNAGTLEIPFGVPDTRIKTVGVWDDEVAARSLGSFIDEWFSDCLKMPCQLVRIEEQASRHNLLGQGSKVVSFADSQPFLLLGEGSLADLNSRLEEPVPMNRFRPNLVLAGGRPFEEDEWSAFTIGDLLFKNIKPCSRCVLTTVDQQRGVKTGKEPLSTLSLFRKQAGSVNFGMLAAPAESTIGATCTTMLPVRPASI